MRAHILLCRTAAIGEPDDLPFDAPADQSRVPRDAHRCQVRCPRANEATARIGRGTFRRLLDRALDFRGGLAEGAAEAGLETPAALAVTVLTSDPDAPPHIVPKRLRIAGEAGCAGIVCAAGDLRDVRELAPRLIRVVPGIRPAGSDAGDQKRVMTPADAIEAGADLLVVGRPVRDANNPTEAASEIARQVQLALSQ